MGAVLRRFQAAATAVMTIELPLQVPTELNGVGGVSGVDAWHRVTTPRLYQRGSGRIQV
jgi:hypothetical protein